MKGYGFAEEAAAVELEREDWEGQEEGEERLDQEHWTRRGLLARGGVVVASAGVATALAMLTNAGPAHAAAAVEATHRRAYARRRGQRVVHKHGKHPAGPPSQPPKFNHPYFHAAFTVNSIQDAELAASLGITHTIAYGNVSLASADPSSAMGQTLARLGMKTFLNVENPYLTCSHGQGQLDEQGVRDLVGRFYQSPVIAGYWTKDDDCGSEASAVQRMYQLIRSIDPNPNHLIMPGFGDSGSVNRNYAPGQGDVLAFYPYPAYSGGPAFEVPRMLDIVRARTPRGQQPPPFIGIYQAFGNPPRQSTPSASAILNEVYTYVRYGAIGVGAYGMQGNAVDIGDSPALRQAVADVSAYLHGH